MFKRIRTPLDDFSKIPSSPGIYRFIDENQEILYIGASKNLQHRISHYFKHSKLKEKKYSKIQILTGYIEYQVCKNQEAAFEAERLQIWTNSPRLNIRNNGIHSYSYLILRKKPHYHLLCGSNEIITRLEEEDEIYRINLHSNKLEGIINQIRKNLKFCTSSKKNSCWDFQINLCVRNCIKTKRSKSSLGIINIDKIITTLKSSDSTLLNEWSKRIDGYIEMMRFEEAKRLHISLESLKILQRRFAGMGYPYDQNRFIFTIPTENQNPISVTIFSYRDGIIASEKNQQLSRSDNFSLEVFLLYFLQDYYQKNTIIPKKVSINYRLDSKYQLRFKKWMRRYFHQPVLLEFCESEAPTLQSTE